MPLDGDLPQEVDVLIVGSGFGGSVMAAELAREHECKPGEPVKICLVERGRAYPPGSFPRDPAGISRNFWDPDAGLYGMFDVRSFENMDAVISSGLGGGSLIYANVMLRKDPTWFTQRIPSDPANSERWMLTANDLAPHYEAVSRFLQVQELPHEPGIPEEFRLTKTTRFLQNTYKANVPKIKRPSQDGKRPEHGWREMGPQAERLYDMELPEVGQSVGNVGGYAPLAVRFRDAKGKAAVGAPLPLVDYGNIHGNAHRRTTCTLVGECDVGCNQGAKNTMDHTYLSEAESNGASIHTLTEVIGLTHNTNNQEHPFEVRVKIHRPSPADYAVRKVGDDVRDYPPIAEPGGDHEATIMARRVVLAAGTLGTTYLLLKNQDTLRIPRTHNRNDQPALGSRFCGNGDFLSFVHGVEGKLDCTRGPVITAYRRYPAETDPPDDPDVPDPGDDGTGTARHGMYIQDAGYPAFAAWLVQLAQAGTIGGNLFNVWLRRKIKNEDASGDPVPPDSSLSAELNDILVNGEFSSKVMPLLGMGRDRPDGRLTLNNDADQLECAWTVGTSESYYKAMVERMQIIANGFRGKLLSNPLYKFLHRGITVHPVGGCPMDTTEEEGVVDTFGRVRGVPGLWVCDGSVFPGPIGPNPSLTIAAFAHRSAHELLRGWATAPAPADEYDPKAWALAHPDQRAAERLRNT